VISELRFEHTFDKARVMNCIIQTDTARTDRLETDALDGQLPSSLMALTFRPQRTSCCSSFIMEMPLKYELARTSSESQLTC
jgi:hypothetical protein